MKKICFVTGTRADYGILAPIMKIIEESPKGSLQIIATNMHLSDRYGMTVEEIEADGFTVDERIESLVEGGDAEATVLSMAKLQQGLSKAYEELKPDMVVVLGDRYEALSAASAAVVFNIPVAHLHGGETTEGAIDDKFRHAITQLSTLHFAATPQYMERIISMGIHPSRVFHSGAPGATGRELHFSPEDPESEFTAKTGLTSSDPFILLAFHPVTLLPDKGEKELEATLEALDTFINQGYKVLATLPNSDPGTDVVTDMITRWASAHPGMVVAVKSLGAALFHYALEIALAMVGNSSAALIEAPTHRLGAVNVGIRQKGRAHGPTVLDVPPVKERIVMAIEAALSMEMKAVLLGMTVTALNPYFKPGAAEFIAGKLLNYKP